MQPATRRASLTLIETALAPNVPVEQRRETLVELRHDNRPNDDTIAAVVSMLVDEDESLRLIAETLLTSWGQQGLSAILKVLRSTEPLEVEYRLAIIRQLARMGTDAARAETLLRSLKDDPNVGAEALAAVKEIRKDFDDLIGRFAQWGIELALLGVIVAAPMIAIRQANPRQVWPPLGIVIGFGALAVGGLLLARYQFTTDLVPDRQSEETTRANRWKVYGQLAVVAAIVGATLGILMSACGGMVQKMFGN